MDAGCGLDFSYPYQPSGYCIAPQRKIIQWDSISTLHCCRNALIVFSLALAQRSCNQTDASIFLEQNQWNNCGGPFRNQPQVSLHYCGFDKFYNGNTTCSTFSVSAVQQRSEFQDVLDSCSLLNSSFDACGNCSQAIKTLTDAMMESKDHQHNADAKASCGLAAVISIAASKWNDSSFIGKLYGCFESLDDLGKNHIQIFQKELLCTLGFYLTFFFCLSTDPGYLKLKSTCKNFSILLAWRQ